MELRRWHFAILPMLISAVVLVGCAKRPQMAQTSAPAPVGAAGAGVVSSNPSEGGPGGTAAQGSEGAGQQGVTPSESSNPAGTGGAGGTAGGAATVESGAGSAGGAGETGSAAPGAGGAAAGQGAGATAGGAGGAGGPEAANGAAGGATGQAGAGGQGAAVASEGGQGGGGTAGEAGAGGGGAAGEQMAAVRPQPSEYHEATELSDIHFDFDRYTIRPEDTKVLDANAGWLKSNPNMLLLIEGHCDERGTNEYNLALGEHRAKSTMSYLTSQGVAASRITIISYGEERPLCTEHTEACWAKNRRAHFLVKGQ